MCCEAVGGPCAQGFEKTGLGERVATLFVKLFGKSTLGLAYGLSVAEALIAPAMPSTTARAGGIFMPIINSLSLADGSKPSARLPGKRLILHCCRCAYWFACGAAPRVWYSCHPLLLHSPHPSPFPCLCCPPD